MKVLIVGANGHTGRIAAEILSRDSEHQAYAMIRSQEQQNDMEGLGAIPVIADLEQEVDHALKDMDAVIFAAGSGSKTGPEKTISVDRDGAIKVVDAAKKAGIKRFVMLSSMGSDYPEQGAKEMQNYYQAKHDADEHLKSSGLSYSIVRPGALSFDDPTGKIVAQEKLESHKGSITRGDVAQVLVHSLTAARTLNKSFEILNGNVPIEEAIENL
ncbi:SDR family oxidoreductase [Peribacillus sp. B-H-3]|uniref:SDR family oxidoreductase n=1 Tax=Peribacillus sp. B-H-3 TaxID=3400420 RepID=UPI003B01121E